MKRILYSALVAGICVMPAMANAQDMNTFVSPYIGGGFGGGELSKSGALTAGVAGGWLGSRWGFEGDVSDSADFFEQDGFRTDRRVTTVSGSGLYRIPTGTDSLRAYAAGGYGVLHPRLAEAGDLARVDVKQGAFNVGGGVMWTAGAVGLRGDVRFFRAMGDEADDTNAFGLAVSTLQFTRATVGLVVRF
jgi:hypothetical protein